MDNREHQNCWEFHDCPDQTRKKCPAFPNKGSRCWEVAASFEGEGCAKTKGMGVIFCQRKCDWFKRFFPDLDK